MGTMQKKMLTVLICATVFLSGCKEEGITPTGKACMGTDNDSLIEGLKGKCQKGDTIATKNPAYFCDFKSQIAFNNYKLRNGLKKPTSVQEKTANLNPDKPPGVPKNKKAGVQVLLRHRTPQTRKPQVSQ